MVQKTAIGAGTWGVGTVIAMLAHWIRQTAVRFAPAAAYVLVCLGTGLAGLVLIVVIAVTCALCLAGIGFLLLPGVLRLLRTYAQFHRRLVGRMLGTEVRTASDPVVRTDLLWLLCHSVPGTALCALALVVCGHAVNWLTAPVWWQLLPSQRDRIILITVDSWWKALAAAVVGIGYAFVAMALMRPLALLHAQASRRLLTALPRPRAGLAQRVRELTLTRAEALDAHGAELRRIERDLHDGAQADIVAVSLRLGMIRRALERRPDQVPDLVDTAQQLAEQALDSLRLLVRGIYPPVLADRGLVEAVRALAALCPVPTGIDLGEAAEPTLRAPAAAEAAAYFVVSEALTNVAKHSGARTALVRLRTTAEAISILVRDDGHGGAAEGAGSGITGLRRRVAAFDGSTELSSPPGGPTVLKVEIPCGS